jgi:deoxyribonuclease-4
MTKPKLKPEELLIGAHTSAAGGAWNALLEGQEIGATTIQLFTANQKRWESKPLDHEAIKKWAETLKETGLKKIMSHDSYLINLGAPDPEVLGKSRAAFRAEVERCQALDLAFLNFHPGAALKMGVEPCLDRICESLLELEPLLHKGSLRLLLEATAGQGSVVGATFEELAYILNKVKGKIPIGICVDTAHIFVAGYDIRTPETFDKTWKDFDRVIGLEHLYALHVNDSMKPFGSRVDRHAFLGEGEIGIECFKLLMRDPRTREIPKYLETPGGPEIWKKEIAMLRKFAEG